MGRIRDFVQASSLFRRRSAIEKNEDEEEEVNGEELNGEEVNGEEFKGLASGAVEDLEDEEDCKQKDRPMEV